MVTEKDINVAYANLNIALANALSETNKVYVLKNELDRKIGRALLSGEIVGKNAEERKAAADELFADEKLDLEVTQRGADIAKLNLQIEQNEVERVRALLRLEELAIGKV